MKSVIIALLVSLVPALAVANEPIRLMTEEFAPYQFYEGSGDVKSLPAFRSNSSNSSNKEIISSWQTTLDGLVKDGTVEDILKSYER